MVIWKGLEFLAVAKWKQLMHIYSTQKSFCSSSLSGFPQVPTPLKERKEEEKKDIFCHLQSFCFVLINTVYSNILLEKLGPLLQNILWP